MKGQGENHPYKFFFSKTTWFGIISSHYINMLIQYLWTDIHIMTCDDVMLMGWGNGYEKII